MLHTNLNKQTTTSRTPAAASIFSASTAAIAIITILSSTCLLLPRNVAALAPIHRLPLGSSRAAHRNAFVLSALRRSSPRSIASTVSTVSTALTMASTASTGATADAAAAGDAPIPPVARRDEDRVVYAGVAPEGWDPKVPRQSDTSTEKLMDPPVAVPDPYGWIRDDKRTNPEMLDLLKAENAYTEAQTKHLSAIKDTIYEELKSSIQETDYTVPRPKGGKYWYYTRTFEGKSYTTYCRAPMTSSELGSIEWDGTADKPILEGEQVYLDVNELGKDKAYCALGEARTSPSQKLLAYSIDYTGNEICEMIVQDLETKEILFEDEKFEVSGNLVWGADDTILYYMRLDPNQRPYQLWKKDLKSDSPDTMLFEDNDDLFYGYVSKSKDGKFLFLEFGSTETSEAHYLDLNDPAATLQCVASRRDKVLYDVDHRHGQFWITSNVGGTPNMRLFTSPVKSESADDWKVVTDPKAADDTPLFDGGHGRSLEGVQIFDTHICLGGREGGIPRVWILSFDVETKTKPKAMEMLTFDEPAHDVGLSSNADFETTHVAIAYDSLVTPTQHLLVSLTNPQDDRTVLKEKKVIGYKKEHYGCDRITVTSRDGKTEIPVSIVYRKDVMEKAVGGTPVPLHLYGYGSYGICVEASFRATRLPLLDRGMIYVLAHIRGGAEMGRPWYEAPNGAKYLCKKNTFNDFVDVGRWLVNEKKLTTSELMSCEGRSAGGMLIGSSINQAPDLFKVAMLGVPFVDVVNTMIDASIPLTPGEWVEWGNPNESKYFQYMMEYCPMKTIKKDAKYPACWLTAGLHDPRVQYWEPTKFVASLRHLTSKDSGPVCLKMDMSAGHFSASDRYKYLRELAYDYSFMLDQLGLLDVEAETKE